MRVSLVLFNRLPLHFCSGREWEQRTIIGGSDFVLNMLSVVCKFTRTLRRCNLQVKQPTTLWRRGVHNIFTRRMREREREKIQLLKVKNKKQHTFYANAIKLHDPLPATAPAIPSQLQLLSLPVSPRTALLPSICLRATCLGLDSQDSWKRAEK